MINQVFEHDHELQGCQAPALVELGLCLESGPECAGGVRLLLPLPEPAWASQSSEGCYWGVLGINRRARWHSAG